MSLLESMTYNQRLRVVQQKELIELIGFESRNKYAIEDHTGALVGYAAEQGKGFLAGLSRQFFGHWREFTIHFFDASRQLAMKAVHPFRLFFQRLEVFAANHSLIGAIQQRFGILYRKFDVLDAQGNLLLSMRAPRWRIWTFPFLKQNRQVGLIQKKWSGLLKEALTDADNFDVVFESPELTPPERSLMLASAVFIDLQYFEKQASE